MLLPFYRRHIESLHFPHHLILQILQQKLNETTSKTLLSELFSFIKETCVCRRNSLIRPHIDLVSYKTQISSLWSVCGWKVSTYAYSGQISAGTLPVPGRGNKLSMPASRASFMSWNWMHVDHDIGHMWLFKRMTCI